MRKASLFTGVALGAAVAFALATPAQAAASRDLHSPHKNSLASDHTQECVSGTDQLDSRMGDKLPNEDGWHFVAAAGTISSFSATFAFDPSKPGETTVISSTPEATARPADPTNPVKFYTAGPHLPHVYVFVPAGSLLVTASVEVTGGTNFVVSHTCAGAPKPSPSPTKSKKPKPSKSPSPSPSESVSPSPSESVSASPSPDVSHEPSKTPEVEVSTIPASGDGGGLPVTGASVGVLAALGLGLVGGGAGLMFLRKRRDLGDLTGS